MREENKKGAPWVLWAGFALDFSMELLVEMSLTVEREFYREGVEWE